LDRWRGGADLVRGRHLAGTAALEAAHPSAPASNGRSDCRPPLRPTPARIDMAQCADGQRDWLRSYATALRWIGVPPGPKSLGKTTMLAVPCRDTFEREPIEENRPT